MSHDVNLREPELIATLYTAITGLDARSIRASKRTNSYLVSCPAAHHADQHPSCQLFLDTNSFACRSHPSQDSKGGILEMIRQARVAERMPGKNPTHSAMLWIEKQLGIERTPMPQPPPKRFLRNPQLVATYRFRHADGALAYEIRRYRGTDHHGHEAKDFRFRRPDGAGKWIHHRGPRCERQGCACHGTGKAIGATIRSMPLFLPEIRAEIAAGRAIIVLEGEGDALAARLLGFAATSLPFGAHEPIPQLLAEDLAGARRIVVAADNDPAGRAHAIAVARSLVDAGLPAVAIDAFADLQPTADASDVIAARGDEAYSDLAERFRRPPLELHASPREHRPENGGFGELP